MDRSIADASPFVTSNVMGTMHLLETARQLPHLKCFFYFSTDEVFGPAPAGKDYTEDDPHNPRNPYAATKSGGEMLVKAYANTYGLPTVITRTMNAFGPRQHPEKFIPTIIAKALKGETLTIHSNPSKTKAGSRFYIHAPTIAQAYDFLLTHHHPGDTYHIVGEREYDNLELAQVIANQLDKTTEVRNGRLPLIPSRPRPPLRPQWGEAQSHGLVPICPRRTLPKRYSPMVPRPSQIPFLLRSTPARA